MNVMSILSHTCNAKYYRILANGCDSNVTRFCIFMFLRVVYRLIKNKKRVVLYIIQSFGCDQAKKRVLARRKRTSLQESGCDSKHDQSSPTHILLISYSCKSALEMYTTRKKTFEFHVDVLRQNSV